MILVTAESRVGVGDVMEMIRKLSLPRKVSGFDYTICTPPVSVSALLSGLEKAGSYQSDCCVSNRKECNLC